MKNLKRSLPLAVVLAGLFLISVIGASALAPMVSPRSPSETDLKAKLTPPTWSDGSGRFLLGSDHLGRDILSRIIWGGRISLTVSVVAVIGAAIVGVSIGLVAAYVGGLPGAAIMRVVDASLAIPLMLIAVTVMAMAGANATNLVLVMILTGWMGFARIIYGVTLSVKELEYVVSARTIGARTRRILFRYILPNVSSPIIVVVSYSLAQMMLVEAALDFLGLGIQPPTPTWGVMLSDARNYLTLAWWPATFPGIFIMFCVLAVNVIGDWLRDYLDPRLRMF